MRLNNRLMTCIVFLISIAAAGESPATDILIDTKLLVSEAADSGTERDDLHVARDHLRSGLYSGLYDSLDIRMRKSDGGQLAIDAASFAAFSSDLQNQVLDRLMEYHSERFVAVYRATVDADSNPLEAVRFFQHIGTPTGLMTGDVPAEKLLSLYAQQWAYRMSTHNGPNCWHTAIASTNTAWKRHRYMNHYEFSCHMRSSYLQIFPADDGLEFGDVISLVDRRGVPVHAFVYLGPDSEHPGRKIVFTKNGYMRSSFLFQDFDTVVNHIYPGNYVLYYRYARTATDPSEAQGGDCEDEYTLDFTEFLRDRHDPVIMAGIRHTDPLLLPPLDIKED